ncbi:MAG: hypothetical protein A2511_06630 [Deltaproteobacteria bacterium RIFOXYD12_FULL_50_9]|nr:MAG: hypothetical protein A2511_06630 [Deltaproteobacteria bacterium RIFOXYD12_FULL_50_9]
MSREKRREDRIAGDIEINISLREGNSGQILAGPLPGKVVNINSYGIGICLCSIRLDSYHLFYSVMGTNDLVMIMDMVIPGKPDENILIQLRPVWFDCDLSSQNWPFVMGLEFVAGSKDEQVQKILTRMMTENCYENSWWRTFVNRILQLFG